MSIIPPPPPESKKKVVTAIPKTKFAGAYQSTFSAAPSSTPTLPLLTHVNCNYLSTLGAPVTLLNLKQHAQALTILIQALSISTSSSAVETGNATFTASETFDWLNDLSEVYQNTTQSHNLPLTSIINNLEPSDNDRKLERPICPLHRVIDGPPHTNALPFSSLKSLTLHADQVLTVLDHELSSTGGLLSLLPFTGPEADAASHTVLGQWINFTRILVSRAHELELAYSTCVDALADEATIPRELMGMLGSSGRTTLLTQSGDQVARQDRYVLANLSDEMWAYLGREFNDAKAAVLDDGRGVTWINIPTRYARLRGGKTVFIVPEWRRIDRRFPDKPTVVQVVKPEYRERASVWESRARAELAAARQLAPENTELKHRVESLEADVKVLQGGEELQAQRVRFLRNLEHQEEMRVRMRAEERAALTAGIQGEYAELEQRTRKLDEEVEQKVKEALEVRVEVEVKKRLLVELKKAREELVRVNDVRVQSRVQAELAKRGVVV